MLKDLVSALKDMEVVDLGQYFEDNMPVHPTHSRFFMVKWDSFALGKVATDYQIIMNEHNGTHVDSFHHYIDKDDYEWIDEIELEKFNGPFACIDATYLKECEVLSLEAVKEFEAKYGEITESEGVLVDTGYMKHWDLMPNDKCSRDYPGVSGEAAKYLADKKIRFIGIDTLSIDCWGADHDPAHYALLGNKIPVIENLCNLDKLHGKRGYLCMLPLKFRHGSASPVRPVALIDKK